MQLSDETRTFLAQFTGQHTYQTFDDRPQKARSLARILYDPAELPALNQRGAGAFVMVNEGDEQGRENRNVRRIRAYFADFDGAPLPGIWPLVPSMIVETSPDRFHAYWILQAGEAPPLDKTAFNQQQEAMAQAVGSRPQDCKGLCRVMRLAGFYRYLHRLGTD